MRVTVTGVERYQVRWVAHTYTVDAILHNHHNESYLAEDTVLLFMASEGARCGLVSREAFG